MLLDAGKFRTDSLEVQGSSIPDVFLVQDEQGVSCVSGVSSVSRQGSRFKMTLLWRKPVSFNSGDPRRLRYLDRPILLQISAL